MLTLPPPVVHHGKRTRRVEVVVESRDQVTEVAATDRRSAKDVPEALDLRGRLLHDLVREIHGLAPVRRQEEELTEKRRLRQEQDAKEAAREQDVDGRERRGDRVVLDVSEKQLHVGAGQHSRDDPPVVVNVEPDLMADPSLLDRSPCPESEELR